MEHNPKWFQNSVFKLYLWCIRKFKLEIKFFRNFLLAELNCILQLVTEIAVNSTVDYSLMCSRRKLIGFQFQYSSLKACRDLFRRKYALFVETISANGLIGFVSVYEY